MEILATMGAVPTNVETGAVVCFMPKMYRPKNSGQSRKQLLCDHRLTNSASVSLDHSSRAGPKLTMSIVSVRYYTRTR